MQTTPLTILTIDDSEIIRNQLIKMLCEIKGVQWVKAAEGAEEGLELAQLLKPLLVILDLSMPYKGGMDIIKMLKQISPSPVLIILTNYSESIFRDHCKMLGADYFLDKSLEFHKVSDITMNILNDDVNGIMNSMPEEKKAITAEIPRGQQETVLVVEDEPDLLEVVVAQLEGLGYTVLSANNGAMALEVAEKNEGIDVLLTDVILRDTMNGPDIAETLQKQRPAIKVVYMSGYTEDALADQMRLNTTIQLLRKPFSRVALAQEMRELLNS